MYYTYRIFNEYGDTLYIGKGSGYRLRKQVRRFGFYGEILNHYSDEAACLRAEIRLIAKHKPPLNKSKGGEAGGHGATVHDNIFYQLCRLIRIANRRPEIAGGLMKIVQTNIARLGFETCKAEFSKFNVTLEEAPRC